MWGIASAKTQINVSEKLQPRHSFQARHRTFRHLDNWLANKIESLGHFYMTLFAEYRSK